MTFSPYNHRKHAHAAFGPTESVQWLSDEGHLERIWRLADAAALLMGIDCIRLDFFTRRGDPDAVVFNEDSISSARNPMYRHIYRYLDQLWLEPHLKKWCAIAPWKLVSQSACTALCALRDE